MAGSSQKQLLGKRIADAEKRGDDDKEKIPTDSQLSKSDNVKRNDVYPCRELSESPPSVGCTLPSLTNGQD